MELSDSDASQDEVNLKFVIAVSRAMKRLTRDFASMLVEYDMTTTQFAVLELLLHKGPQRIGQIQEKILATAGNLTLVVSNLVNKRWVRRRKDPDDRRVWTVELTSEGEKLIATLFPIHVRELRRNLHVVGIEEKRFVVETMKRIGKQS